MGLEGRGALLAALAAEDPAFRELQALVEKRFAEKPQHTVGVVYDGKQLESMGACTCPCCLMIKADKHAIMANVVNETKQGMVNLRRTNKQLANKLCAAEAKLSGKDAEIAALKARLAKLGLLR